MSYRDDLALNGRPIDSLDASVGVFAGLHSDKTKAARLL